MFCLKKLFFVKNISFLFKKHFIVLNNIFLLENSFLKMFSIIKNIVLFNKIFCLFKEAVFFNVSEKNLLIFPFRKWTRAGNITQNKKTAHFNNFSKKEFSFLFGTIFLLKYRFQDMLRQNRKKRKVFSSFVIYLYWKSWKENKKNIL